ncbi:MAG: hypothetical protein VCD66_16280, partial [Alphaproteobacteria bacterium]
VVSARAVIAWLKKLAENYVSTTPRFPVMVHAGGAAGMVAQAGPARRLLRGGGELVMLKD